MKCVCFPKKEATAAPPLLPYELDGKWGVFTRAPFRRERGIFFCFLLSQKKQRRLKKREGGGPLAEYKNRHFVGEKGRKKGMYICRNVLFNKTWRILISAHGRSWNSAPPLRSVPRREGGERRGSSCRLLLLLLLLCCVVVVVGHSLIGETRRRRGPAPERGGRAKKRASLLLLIPQCSTCTYSIAQPPK